MTSAGLALRSLGLLLVWFSTAIAQTGTMRLENDVRIKLRDDKGGDIGELTISAGMDVEVLGADEAEEGAIRFSYVGQIFSIPTGERMQEALRRLNPPETPAEECVFDVEAWKRLQKRDHLVLTKSAELARGELKWPGAGKYRAVRHWPEVPPSPFEEVPDDFAWDQTVIMPGRFAYLKLPFIKQTVPGICVAASSINVLAHLDPELDLSGRELFRICTDREAGASLNEGSFGMLQFGVGSRIVPTRALPSKKMVEQIEQSLDRNLPVLAADRRHVVLIYGYNREREKLFVWNQWGNGKIVNGMPKGTYELQYSDLPIEFQDLVFVDPVRFEPSMELDSWLQVFLGEVNDLRIHPVSGVRSQKRLAPFVKRAGPVRFKAIARAGRTALIPLPTGELLCVPPQEIEDDSDRMSCTILPSDRQATYSLADLSMATIETHGEFYSCRTPSHERSNQSPTSFSQLDLGGGL